MMRLEIPQSDLLSLLARQIDNFFMLDGAEKDLLADALPVAMDAVEHCFSRVDNKYYRRGDGLYFNPFHSGQYTIFLYWVARTLFERHPERTVIADKVYYLNKCMNGLDLFYEVKMPPVFFLDHPVGTVLGRGSFGNYFTFLQNCTVGGNKDVYPILGENVQLLSGAKVVGRSHVGDNVIISANAYVKDTDIPSCSIVFGSSPDLVIKPKEPAYFRQNFLFD